jgi:hypothetical protein
VLPPLADPVFDAAWSRALELAWDAFCAGTTPVGAVVVSAAAAAASHAQLADLQTALAAAPLSVPCRGCPSAPAVRPPGRRFPAALSGRTDRLVLPPSPARSPERATVSAPGMLPRSNRPSPSAVRLSV